MKMRTLAVGKQVGLRQVVADPKLLARVARAEAEIRRGDFRTLDDVFGPRPRRRQ